MASTSNITRDKENEFIDLTFEHLIGSKYRNAGVVSSVLWRDCFADDNPFERKRIGDVFIQDILIHLMKIHDIFGEIVLRDVETVIALTVSDIVKSFGVEPHIQLRNLHEIAHLFWGYFGDSLETYPL